MALTVQRAFLLRSARETRALGRALGRAVGPGAVIALTGPLGAGKTTLAQGLAAGLGVRASRVRSPTFSVLDEHQGRIPFHHADFYRLADGDEMEGIGLSELLGGEGVSAVEWADLFPQEIPAGAIWVHLDHVASGGRVAELRGPGGAWAGAVDGLGLPPWDPAGGGQAREAH